jgi:hypothetical protein
MLFKHAPNLPKKNGVLPNQLNSPDDTSGAIG